MQENTIWQRFTLFHISKSPGMRFPQALHYRHNLSHHQVFPRHTHALPLQKCRDRLNAANLEVAKPFPMEKNQDC